MATTLIKVDIDGVLRNWNASLIRHWEAAHPGEKVVYPFADFNIAASFPPGADNRKFYLEEQPYMVYRYAEPYVGAVDFLRRVIQEYPNVWLVTTQYERTMFPTMEWVEAFLPAADVPLVFSKEKGLVGKYQFEETILIDDAPHNLDNQVKHGGTAFCFGHLYNSHHNPSKTWVSFQGTGKYSVEDEAERLKQQYDAILLALHAFMHGRPCGV
jgi:5'(3')-deoxyribonucleotidase